MMPPSPWRTRSVAKTVASVTDGTAKHTATLPLKTAVVETSNARVGSRRTKPFAVGGSFAGSCGRTEVTPAVDTLLKVIEDVLVGVTVTLVPVGVAAMGGGTTSVTVTVNERFVSNPELLTAEHATIVVSTGNVEPEAGAQLTGRVPSLKSVAVGVT